jgi:hypothetical protein
LGDPKIALPDYKKDCKDQPNINLSFVMRVPPQYLTKSEEAPSLHGGVSLTLLTAGLNQQLTELDASIDALYSALVSQKWDSDDRLHCTLG